MYENMTDEELIAEIDKVYGDDWTPEQLDPESELTKEYTKRMTQGF